MLRRTAIRIEHMIGVERGELGRVGSMAIALFLLVAVLTTTKVVRDATFLARFEIVDLTYVMLAMAVLTGFALKAYNYVTAHRARNQIIWVLNSFVAFTLLLISAALRRGGRHVPIALYVWSGISILVVLSEFWLLANNLFNAREAKRLFAVVAAGGVLGGIFGGATSRYFAARLHVGDLLVGAAAELVLAAVACEVAWRLSTDREASTLSSDEPVVGVVQVLRGSAYARWIAFVFVLMTIATTFVDWQFKAYAKLHFASQATEMARFFGVLAIVLGVFSLALQLVGTHRLLRLVGAGGYMRALPVSCGAGALFVLATLVLPIMPLVAAAAASMLLDSVQFSIDRSATELLFMPMPDDTRSVFKRFVDTALDRFAGALAAVAWIVLVWLVHIDRPERLVFASVATLVLVAGWLFGVEQLRAAYVDAYRAFIGAPPVDAAHPMPALSRRERQHLERLLARLHSDATERLRGLRRMTSIQHSSPLLGLASDRIEPHLELELDELDVLQLIHASIDRWSPPRLQTLRRLVRGRIPHALERIVRLLALVYPPSDVASLHRALRRHATRQRAAALEFLDALVDLPSRARLVRIIEILALESGDLEPIDKEDGLRKLFLLRDAKLRACAVWSACASSVLLDQAVQLAVSDSSPVVRAVARMSLAAQCKRPQTPLTSPHPKVELARGKHAP